MTLDEAINSACDAVGIVPPKRYQIGRWAKTDTMAGKSGKGDGRAMIDDDHVTAWNWQTGEKQTVWLDSDRTPEKRRETAQRIAVREREQRARAAEAAKIAERLVSAATLATHPYLAMKGFPEEKALTIEAAAVRSMAGKYLLTPAGGTAIVVPARNGQRIASVQLIWEDGTKRFLANGEMEGATHRLSAGTITWACEGFASGLTLRTALKGLHRNDCVLCCFSAYNVKIVARSLSGKRFIVTDNDKPLPQYDGLGTGEYWARQGEVPYLMPPILGDDLNDVHQRDGIFAVQRLLVDFLRTTRT
jgi:putative DNA primase/helicase